MPAFSTSIAVNMTAIFVMLGSFLFIAQYLQLVRGMSSLEAGMWLLPQSVTFVFGSNMAPVLARRLRTSTIVASGLAVTSLGFLLLTQVGPSSGLGFLVAALVLTSLGLSTAFTLTIDIVVSSAPAERAGSASAMSETGTELGGALGIAILGSIGTAVYRHSVTDALRGRVPGKALHIATDTLGGAIGAAEKLPGRVGDLMVDAGRDAFTQGLRLTAVIGAVVMMGAAVAVAAVLGRSPAGAPEVEAHSELTDVSATSGA
jgi:DHA2 family multidrug resistance protein-like MFS transporter